MILDKKIEEQNALIKQREAEIDRRNKILEVKAKENDCYTKPFQDVNTGVPFSID